MFNRLFGSKHSKDRPPIEVVVVSGLPRSGTSMMMKMLEAGGLPVLTDHLRMADHDNPQGYYEFERVKQLDKGDRDWLEEAHGKVVKVISALLEHLPATCHERPCTYKVLFMQRAIAEVLESQRKMLVRRGEATNAISDDEMAKLFERHMAKTKQWLQEQPNFAVLDVDYNAMLADPQSHVPAINRFLSGALNERAMVEAVNPQLYRNRAEAGSV